MSLARAHKGSLQRCNVMLGEPFWPAIFKYLLDSGCLQVYTPIVEAVSKRLDADFNVSDSIFGSPQPEATVAAIRSYLEGGPIKNDFLTVEHATEAISPHSIPLRSGCAEHRRVRQAFR